MHGAKLPTAPGLMNLRDSGALKASPCYPPHPTAGCGERTKPILNSLKLIDVASFLLAFEKLPSLCKECCAILSALNKFWRLRLLLREGLDHALPHRADDELPRVIGARLCECLLYLIRWQRCDLALNCLHQIFATLSCAKGLHERVSIDWQSCL